MTEHGQDARRGRTPRSAADVRERGANGQTSDRRLFMQLQVLTGVAEAKPLVAALEASGVPGVALRRRERSAGRGRPRASPRTRRSSPASSGALLGREPFAGLTPRPELTMLGRTYASGFEPDLEDWLLAPAAPHRAESRVAVGHLVSAAPDGRLRAPGRPRSRRASCASTATIGRGYGDADLAHDVRLACHGLDTHDNDFVIGLVGRELHPLSHLSRPCAGRRRPRPTSQIARAVLHRPRALAERRARLRPGPPTAGRPARELRRSAARPRDRQALTASSIWRACTSR